MRLLYSQRLDAYLQQERDSVEENSLVEIPEALNLDAIRKLVLAHDDDPIDFLMIKRLAENGIRLSKRFESRISDLEVIRRMSMTDGTDTIQIIFLSGHRRSETAWSISLSYFCEAEIYARNQQVVDTFGMAIAMAI